ncbi:hypothetical protein D3C86_1230130 [compost metagenome]
MEYNADLQNINIPRTEQEDFWAGEFGNAYVERNKYEHYVADSLAFFSKVIARTERVNKILELGANVGLNLMALKHLLPNAEFTAVEINEKAVATLKKKCSKR